MDLSYTEVPTGPHITMLFYSSTPFYLLSPLSEVTLLTLPPCIFPNARSIHSSRWVNMSLTMKPCLTSLACLSSLPSALPLHSHSLSSKSFYLYKNFDKVLLIKGIILSTLVAPKCVGEYSDLSSFSEVGQSLNYLTIYIWKNKKMIVFKWQTQGHTIRDRTKIRSLVPWHYPFFFSTRIIKLGYGRTGLPGGKNFQILESLRVA